MFWIGLSRVNGNAFFMQSYVVVMTQVHNDMSRYNEVMLSSVFVYQGGITSLMLAAVAGKVKVASRRLEEGADISAADKVPSRT